MQHYKEILKQSRYFLLPYLVILVIAIGVLTLFTKAQIHIWINQHWSEFGDSVFPRITFLGDGIFVIGVIILLLFYRFGYSILVAATYAISGIVVQLIKNFISPHIQRPVPYLEGIYNLHLVQGVQILSSKSFPSGHSASAFALFLCFAFLTKNKLLQFVFFMIACLIAFSRVYLSQHFLIDITTGSAIGAIATIIYYNYHLKIKGDWMNKSIITVFKK